MALGDIFVVLKKWATGSINFWAYSRTSWLSILSLPPLYVTFSCYRRGVNRTILSFC